MKCLVCDSKMIYYFRKSFEKFELNDVEYWKCTNCGFVSSKTHYEMSEEKFASLNISYHQAYQSMDFNPDDPRWLVRLNAQAEMIDDAATIGLIKEDGKWIDYACGGGQLSALLGAKFDRSLLSYDKYMERRPGFLDHRDLIQQHFDFVISTSVFEHFRKREHYDSVQSLVRSGGGEEF